MLRHSEFVQVREWTNPLNALQAKRPTSVSTLISDSMIMLLRPNAGLGENLVGRWLGVSQRVGQLMSYWILPVSGIPISCMTVQRMTNLEKQTDENIARMADFEAAIKPKIKMNLDTVVLVPNDIPDDLTLETFENESNLFQTEFNRVIDDPDLPHGADDEPEQE